LVGYATVTDPQTAAGGGHGAVYRKQLRPVIQTGTMDALFGDDVLKGDRDA